MYQIIRSIYQGLKSIAFRSLALPREEKEIETKESPGEFVDRFLNGYAEYMTQKEESIEIAIEENHIAVNNHEKHVETFSDRYIPDFNDSGIYHKIELNAITDYSPYTSEEYERIYRSIQTKQIWFHSGDSDEETITVLGYIPSEDFSMLSSEKVRIMGLELKEMIENQYHIKLVEDSTECDRYLDQTIEYSFFIASKLPLCTL